MGWWSQFLNPDFQTIDEAEQAVFRAFSIGFLVTGTGFIIRFVILPTIFGIIVMSLGGMILLGSIIRFILISKHAETMNCPRCGAPNPVFGGESHFKCSSCGRVVILREV